MTALILLAMKRLLVRRALLSPLLMVRVVLALAVQPDRLPMEVMPVSPALQALTLTLADLVFHVFHTLET